MNCGKPNPYSFVAYKKIYAFATSMPFNYKLMNLSRFEVFDLDSNKWSILPDPPMKKKLTGHALVDTKVFILTWDNEILFQCGHVSAEFVEDTLYSIYFDYTIAAFGPTCESKFEAKAKGLFDRMAFLSSDVADVIENHLRVKCPSAYLVHLGNKIFYYVLTGGLPDPKNPYHICFGDTEKRAISIITFEALRETYTESSSNGDRTFFLGKIVAHCTICRQKQMWCLC
ncbi:unnamed protein product [Camellia sinensis]